MKVSLTDTTYAIYKVTSPSGRVYIGQTRQGLKQRRQDHLYAAKKSSFSFAKAIRKYGDSLSWEVIEDDIRGSDAATEREIFWIKHFKSNNKKYGYNLTKGGEGGKLNSESENKRIAAIRRALKNNPKISKKSSDTAKKNWATKREEIIAAIKKKRSTPESRSLTSKRSRERVRTAESSENISKALKDHYSDPSNKEKTSKALRAAKAKPFAVFKDGIEVGRYFNQAAAVDALGVPQGNMGAVLAGRRKSAGGYVFKYVSESINPQTRGGQDEPIQSEP